MEPPAPIGGSSTIAICLTYRDNERNGFIEEAFFQIGKCFVEIFKIKLANDMPAANHQMKIIVTSPEFQFAELFILEFDLDRFSFHIWGFQFEEFRLQESVPCCHQIGWK